MPNNIKINKEKLVKIVDKCILPIEFIIAIFFAYSVYKITLFKNYGDIWPLKYLILSFFSGLIIIVAIIFQYKVNKEKIEKIFISFLIPVGMLYIFFIAPSYAPDEHAHIWKAYEVSTGKIITHIKEDGSSPTEIPKFFNKERIPYVSTYQGFDNAKNIETNYEETVNVENPAQNYPAILYVISAIAFWFGRIFGINGIITIYLAKIFNFIIFLVLGYYSIKIIPFGKKILGIVLFLPMSFQQGTSISADCILNAFAIFYIAYTLFLYKKGKEIELKDKIIYILISILLGIAKIAYFPMIGLSFLFIGIKNASKKKKIIFMITIVIITLICSLSWYMFMQRYQPTQTNKEYMENNNVNASEQIKLLIKHPENLLVVILNSLHDGSYIESAIGKQLGWLNIEVSQGVIIAFISLLILSPFLDKNENELTKIEKIWVCLIALSIYLLIIAVFYITYTAVGADKVAGVQGRYYLPILAMPLLCLCKKERYIKFENINTVLPILLTILNIVAIIDVSKFFI